jgi:DNA-binding NtrC family response regulator
MGEKLEIMIIDDEEIVGTRLKPTLEKEGFVVETFIDSREAKKRLEEHRYDIVVTDLKMAEVDGMELFRFVKEVHPATEVILISGFVTVEVTRAALQAGVADVIQKPFRISRLKEVIHTIAGRIGGDRESGNHS